MHDPPSALRARMSIEAKAGINKFITDDYSGLGGAAAGKVGEHTVFSTSGAAVLKP